MSEITRALSGALVDFLWQGALVGVVLWVVLLSLRHRSASARYAVSCVALLTLAVLPIWTLTLLWTRNHATAGVAALGAGVPWPGSHAPETMLPIWLVADGPERSWLATAQTCALPLWSLGVLLFSFRFARGCAHAFLVQRRAPLAHEAIRASVARLAPRIGVTRPVRTLASSLSDGPSVAGWLRPALFVPPAAAMGLTPQQLEAVLAHELAHIRRHDYLINMIQMMVEAVLFYHPIVWWASNQIRIEREACCDDVAVRACGDPVSYARALTTLARQRVAIPVPTMAATGGSLLYRVRRLLGAADQSYGPSRAPLAAALGLAMVCGMLNLDWFRAFAAQQMPNPPRFEVASIKTNNRNDGLVSVGSHGDLYQATGISALELIRSAYQVQEFQIVGNVAWLNTVHFDISAKREAAAPDGPESGLPPAARLQLMLRSLLEDRFQLLVHKETRDMPVFALVIARKDGLLGPQLHPSTVDCSAPAAAPARGSSGSLAAPGACGTSVGPGVVLARDRTMAQVASALSTLTNTGSSLNRLVVDRTGLGGPYSLELHFTPEHMPAFGPGGPPPGMPTIDPNGPSIFAAVQEQLGLKLDAQRGPVDVLVVDRIARPTED
jgi:uncharacterized protein (TIGR03435 family)